MATKYVLKLSEEERETLSRIAKGTRGKQAIAAWKVVRAKALLKCDQGEFGPAWTDERIADAVDATERSVQNWRKKAVLEVPRWPLFASLASLRLCLRKSMDASKHTSRSLPARHLRTAAIAGRSDCWPIKSSNLRSSIRCRTRQSAKR